MIVSDALKKMFVQALGDRVVGENILLEEWHDYDTYVVKNEDGSMSEHKVKKATLQHCIEVDVILNMYKDVITSPFVKRGKRLEAMLKKKFVSPTGKVINNGLNIHIDRWINEGVKF